MWSRAHCDQFNYPYEALFPKAWFSGLIFGVFSFARIARFLFDDFYLMISLRWSSNEGSEE